MSSAVAATVPRSGAMRWGRCQEDWRILPSLPPTTPRYEEPQAIIDDIRTGIEKTDGRYIEIIDRKEAIRYAIAHGQKDDVIVLAGKGHEDYQEIRGKKYPMDERVLIAEVLEELKGEKDAKAEGCGQGETVS